MHLIPTPLVIRDQIPGELRDPTSPPGCFRQTSMFELARFDLGTKRFFCRRGFVRVADVHELPFFLPLKYYFPFLGWVDEDLRFPKPNQIGPP